MPDMVLPGPVENNSCCALNVNIHTSKIFDCCRDKDCVEDLRVYPTVSSQALINCALSVRPSSAVLLGADVNVDPISFNRGYYTVDVTFFYRVTGNTFPGGSEVTGLAVFDKRVILFGSEGTVKVFSSGDPCSVCPGPSSDSPTAYVEAVDPIALNMKVLECDACPAPDCEMPAVPACIIEAIGEELVMSGTGRRLYATLGQFSIIRLERDTQLKLCDVSYFFPDKECAGSSSEDDPCALFGKVAFPVEEFFPPDSMCERSDYKDLV